MAEVHQRLSILTLAVSKVNPDITKPLLFGYLDTGHSHNDSRGQPCPERIGQHSLRPKELTELVDSPKERQWPYGNQKYD
jgi:hypothetical protein